MQNQGTFYEDIGFISNPPTSPEVGRTTKHLTQITIQAIISPEKVDETTLGRTRKREQKIVNSTIDAPAWATELIEQINQQANQIKENHQMISLVNARLFNSKMRRDDLIEFPVKYDMNENGVLTTLKERNPFMIEENRTIARFSKLRAASLNEILNYYNLPIVQLVDDKKLSISRFLQFSLDK